MTGVTVQSRDAATLAAATGLGLYRIAQESLANVVRHGGESARTSPWS